MVASGTHSAEGEVSAVNDDLLARERSRCPEWAEVEDRQIERWVVMAPASDLRT